MKLRIGGKTLNPALIAVLALLVLIPLIFLRFSYGVMICCFIEIYVIAVSGFDLLWGYCGQISFGHAGFYAIGAYGSMVLNKYCGIPVIISIFLAAVAATIIGAILAYPVSKLRFQFLVLATIAFGEIVYQVICHSPGGVTGDYLGTTYNTMHMFGIDFKDYTAFYYLGLVITILFIAAKSALVHSRVGRALLAIKQNVHAAEGMGINVRRYKIIAFAVSAFYCAFAGGLYGALVGFISPDTFMKKTSVMFIAMSLLGGNCSIAGPIVGTFCMLLINEALRYAQEYQTLVYGVVLLAVILLLPRGIVGEISQRLNARKAGKAALKGVNGNA